MKKAGPQAADNTQKVEQCPAGNSGPLHPGTRAEGSLYANTQGQDPQAENFSSEANREIGF